MKLDNTLVSLIDDLLSGSSQEDTNDTLWNDTQGYIKLAELSENPYKTLRIKPRRRTYLNRKDAGYDWACGAEFVVTDRNSPFYEQIVAVDETMTLKRYGYETVQIEYNTSVRPLEMSL